MFLHHNCLCFIWHSEFAALREFIGSMTMTAQHIKDNHMDMHIYINSSNILELTSLFLSSVVVNTPFIGSSQTSCLDQCHNGKESSSTRDLSWYATKKTHCSWTKYYCDSFSITRRLVPVVYE